uniref:Cullin N-terminal domain-containing protein n=1 Tax=Oryza meridionalis TaxID=40149 RepID=A0A0E0FAN4_9ORYZ
MAGTVDFEEGWRLLATSLAKQRSIIDGSMSNSSSSKEDDNMQLYMMVYNMCTQKPPHNYAQQLYERYKTDIDGYNSSTVLPSMRQINGEILLKGLVERWRNHKRIVIREMRFFFYLDCYYISRKSLVPLEQLNLCSFRDQIGLGMECYEVDFEIAFRESTRNYYSNKAQTLILEYNGPDSAEYMLKDLQS